MLFQKSQRFVLAAVGAALLSPFAFASATCNQDKAAAQEKISLQLDAFEHKAATTRNELDRYASSARGGKLPFESHARNLNSVRDNVNYLGRELGAMESCSAFATDLQQSAMREARPHLVEMAENVSTTIAMLNENQRIHRSVEFREKIQAMYEHSDNLYTKVDAITDYERSRDRAIDVAALTKSDI